MNRVLKEVVPLLFRCSCGAKIARNSATLCSTAVLWMAAPQGNRQGSQHFFDLPGGGSASGLRLLAKGCPHVLSTRENYSTQEMHEPPAAMQNTRRNLSNARVHVKG